jgi:tetratricopeptide (TPR) repeat protein
VRLALTLLTLAALARPAAADAPELTALARKHYEAGRALYSLGKYDQAIVEFEEGYRIAPRPSFLVNIAQSHRQGGRIAEARANYEKFLAAADRDDPMRADVQQILRTLREPAAPPRAPAPPPPPPQDAIVAPTPPRPWHRDPAGGVLLGAAAASIVAGAVVLGVSSYRVAHQNDSYDDFLAAQSVPEQRIAGGVLVSAGVVFAVGGAVRYALVRK